MGKFSVSLFKPSRKQFSSLKKSYLLNVLPVFSYSDLPTHCGLSYCKFSKNNKKNKNKTKKKHWVQGYNII